MMQTHNKIFVKISTNLNRIEYGEIIMFYLIIKNVLDLCINI